MVEEARNKGVNGWNWHGGGGYGDGGGSNDSPNAPGSWIIGITRVVVEEQLVVVPGAININDNGGNGGSGFVVIRYKIGSVSNSAKASGGAISFYGGKTIHAFTKFWNFY